MRRSLVFVLALSGACLPGTVTETACNEDNDCETDEVCKNGVCAERGVVVPLACGNGTREADEACDDGNLANGDGCDATCALEGDGGGCVGAGCGPSCTIDDQTVEEGARSPTDPCAVCRPDVDATAWTADDDGTPCAPAQGCPGSGTCQGGQCVDAVVCGDTLPACRDDNTGCVCAGASCDDGLFCNGEERCDDDGACAPGEAPLCDLAAPLCSEDLDRCVTCIEDGDCATSENPFCVGYTCTPCPECACPLGEHDGGDGTCVPDGTCADGFARLYLDGDEDGVGAGAPGDACEPLPAPDGFAVVGGDCDDEDPLAYTIVTAFPDFDDDGMTGPAQDVCAGDALPAGFRSGPVAAPRVSLHALDGDNVNGGAGTRSWSDEWAVRYVDGSAAFCDPEDVGCRFLRIDDLRLDVPDTATVTGVEVEIVRRVSNDSVGVIFDGTIQLGPDGNAAGANRADPTTPWPASYTAARYGGPGDLWDLALTPAILNDNAFGIMISVPGAAGLTNQTPRVDGVRVLVYTDEDRPDCDDGDATRFAERALFVDEDSDWYAAGPATLECVGLERPPGMRQNSSGEDCYDANNDAFPGQTDYFGVHRGDGSFDYNCSNSITKQSITAHTACTCSAVPSCDATTTSVTPSANCGNSVNINRCGGECTTPTCALGSQSFQVQCR